MIFKIKKDEDTEDMLTSCFIFKEKAIQQIIKSGYKATKQNSKLDIIEDKIFENETPHLNTYEATMLAELITMTCETLLKAEPPYTENELKFFRVSDSFLAEYRRWLEKNE